uniref:Uncharacterized protein n=1 Tax=Molossus molossus TaxID=27622 RepID=A0A7J8EES2_MOLMO|nr:hypothetical protein HJG59_008920 [Molossus molossus]
MYLGVVSIKCNQRMNFRKRRGLRTESCRAPVFRGQHRRSCQSLSGVARDKTMSCHRIQGQRGLHYGRNAQLLTSPGKSNQIRAETVTLCLFTNLSIQHRTVLLIVSFFHLTNVYSVPTVDQKLF